MLVKPMEQSNYGFLLNWVGLSGSNLSAQQVRVVYGVGLLLTVMCVYQVLQCDIGQLFYRLCSLIVPMFCIVNAFYWLSLVFRKCWSNTSLYLLFSSCYVGEIAAQVMLVRKNTGVTGEQDDVSSMYIMQPSVVLAVLIAISFASLFSSLETLQSAAVILLVSFTRFLACTSLVDLPQSLRPFVAYSCGFCGIIVSKYLETVFKTTISNNMTQDGKIPVIKRRRSSSSAHGFPAHKSIRRTSLPALIQKPQVRIHSFIIIVIEPKRRNIHSSYLLYSRLQPSS